MFKAIIEKIENDGYSAKIRIPFFNGYSSSTGSTSDYELYTASICSAPGCDPAYREGDIVYIDFEDRDYGKPVIVGIFYREDYLSSANINSQSLSVAVSADFPEDVSIGNVGRSNIKSLTRISDNVQAQLTELDGSIKNVSTDIPTKVSQLENDLNFVNESALQTVENSIPTKVSQLENDEEFINENTLNDISSMYFWEVFTPTNYRLNDYTSIERFVDNETTVTVYYSDSVYVTGFNSVVLGNDYSTITLDSTSANVSSSVNSANSTLIGKYISIGSVNNTIYYVSNISGYSNFTYTREIGSSGYVYHISLNYAQQVYACAKLINYTLDFDVDRYPSSGTYGQYYYKLIDTVGNLFFKNTINTYVWKKYDYTPQSYSYTEYTDSNFSSIASDWYYADSIKILSNGTIGLINPNNNYISIARSATGATNANNKLVGKYTYRSGYTTIYYIPSDATFSYSSGYVKVTKMQILSGIAEIKTFDSYICDLYEHAYPDNNYIDNYWYKKQYKLIDKLNDFESRITALENASTT